MEQIKGFANTIEKTFNFSGRSSRAEFWHFTIISLLIIFTATAMDHAIASLERDGGVFQLFTGLLLIAPSFSLNWRRAQDLGLAGWVTVPLFLWWIMQISIDLGVITKESSSAEALSGLDIFSLVAALPYLVIALFPGSKAQNRFGPPPVR